MDDTPSYPRRRIYLDGKPQRDAVLKALAGVWKDHPPLFFGVSYEKTLRDFISKRDPFVFIDHAYFKRGYNFGNFRVCVNSFHHNHWVERPDDRREKWCPTLNDWRKDGQHIVVVPPAETWSRVLQLDKSWGERVCRDLAQITRRPVIHLSKKGGFGDALRKAWAVVVHCSVAGMEAAIAGVPVFCEKLCPASPVGLPMTELSRINDPWLPTDDERKRWLNSLCYSTWNVKEFHQIPGAYEQYLGRN
jgi:hypothetical protein